jgi:hypothetical protein
MMPKKSGTYYEIINREIFESIVNEKRVKTIEVLHDQQLQGKTTKHQIDVYWEFEDSGVTYRNVVQVKDWGGRVTKGEMLKFLKVIEDLPNQPRGFFVSKNGYQRGAKEVAEKHGILLHTLTTVFNDDKKSIASGIMEWRFSLSDASDYHFELDAKWIEEEAKRLGLRLGKAGSQITFRPQDVNFYDESENVVANLLEIVHSKYPKGVSKSATKVHVHKFGKPTFMDSSNKLMPRYKVLSVKFTITTTRHVRRTPIVGTPVVEFILENVLEKSSRTFGRDFKPK